MPDKHRKQFEHSQKKSMNKKLLSIFILIIIAQTLFAQMQIFRPD
jgi:hypothetical protein